MDPIVSPWAIYGIEMLEPLGVIARATAALSCITIILLWSLSLPYNTTEEERMACKSKLWIPTTILVVSVFATVLLPSRETGYKMLAASYVTTDNIRAVGGATNEAIDSILDNVVKHMNEVKK